MYNYIFVRYLCFVTYVCYELLVISAGVYMYGAFLCHVVWRCHFIDLINQLLAQCTFDGFP